jgi:aromatic ring hydroxylase
MGVRTGKAYVEGLRDDRRIYVNGELVRDVIQYPPLSGRDSHTRRFVRPST